MFFAEVFHQKRNCKKELKKKTAIKKSVSFNKKSTQHPANWQTFKPQIHSNPPRWEVMKTSQFLVTSRIARPSLFWRWFTGFFVAGIFALLEVLWKKRTKILYFSKWWWKKYFRIPKKSPSPPPKKKLQQSMGLGKFS